MNFNDPADIFIPAGTLSEQITEFLTDAIINDQLGNGHRLVEEVLQRKFRVSRGPIREAFRLLDKDGLVTIVPRKGTFIRAVSAKELKEIFPIMAYLESIAATTAVSYQNAAHIEEMESALSKMAKGAKENDTITFVQSHLAFHCVLTEASNNDTLVRILKPLRRKTTWRTISPYPQERFELSISVHREILDLFVKKDAERLGRLVKEHIFEVAPQIIRLVESRNAEQKSRIEGI